MTTVQTNTWHFGADNPGLIYGVRTIRVYELIQDLLYWFYQEINILKALDTKF